MYPDMKQNQIPQDDILLQEYAIAHQELSRCSNIFWTQAEFFLTLSTAMLCLGSDAVLNVKPPLDLAVERIHRMCRWHGQ